MADDPESGVNPPRRAHKDKLKTDVAENVSDAAVVALADARARVAVNKSEIDRGEAEHRQAIVLKTLEHDQRMAEEAARHRRQVTWAMIVLGVLVCTACVGVGFAPGLSDDLKKTIVGVLAIFLSGGVSFAVGRSGAGK